jgi:hypothetical protein
VIDYDQDEWKLEVQTSKEIANIAELDKYAASAGTGG